VWRREKKPKNLLNKKITEKIDHEKKLIKPIIIFKKIFGSVQFWFYKPETKNQTEPEKKNRTNRNQAH
jgi:hypothetical protein